MPPSPTPTSFIPKKPLDSTTTYRESGSFGFLFFIALFIFIASIVAAAGVFGYETFLNTSISSKQASLQKEEAAFDPEQINQLIRLDSRINNVKTLLGNHIAPSAIFAFLSQQTLQNVQLTGFQYSLNKDGTASIVLSGIADTFASVALQSDQFNAANQVLKDVVFSGVDNSGAKSVKFSVTANVASSLINYTKNLGNSPAVVPVAPPAPAAATSTTSTSTKPTPPSR
ncbi:hypothetical protein K2Q00_02305 [Patescibacteria group bacterium]|nr:hypothetical protein [Patescibacteria group bacterium]